MTDNEIIKALEWCFKGKCGNCPLRIKDDKLNLECINELSQLSLDLINRQQAENENLEYKLLGVMHFVDKWLDGDELKQDEVYRAATMREKTLRLIETAKAEAIKEFAERLKKNFLASEYQANTTRKTLPIDFVKDQMKWVLHEVSVETIDNLVKEMAGEE